MSGWVSVVLVVPHQSSESYIRAIEAGSLEDWRRGPCVSCSGHLVPCGTRRRITLGIVVLRARCEECGTYYTFLPAFAAPAKWYGYSDIRRAVNFVLIDCCAIAPTAALNAWEMLRTDRIDSGRTPGPSRSTVRRWIAELGQVPPPSPWPGRVEKELESVTAASQCPAREGFGLPATWLFLALERLGKRVAHEGLGLVSAGTVVLGTLLALGTWYVEALFRQRCIASLELKGTVVPCMQPDVAQTRWPRRDYLPAKSLRPP